MRSLFSRKSQRQQRLDLSRVIFHGSTQGSRLMSLNVTDDRSEGDRQTSVQMTNGSKSEFFSEFSRDRGGDRRPVGGEQLVQVEEEEECTSSGVEWSGTLVRVSLVHRAHQRILSTSQKTFSSPSDALRIRESRLTIYSHFGQAGQHISICCGMRKIAFECEFNTKRETSSSSV